MGERTKDCVDYFRKQGNDELLRNVFFNSSFRPSKPIQAWEQDGGLEIPSWPDKHLRESAANKWVAEDDADFRETQLNNRERRK